MECIKYNLILSKRRYKLVREGAKRATVTFKEGDELQRYIGWLVLNRDCLIYVHGSSGEVSQKIISDIRTTLESIPFSARKISFTVKAKPREGEEKPKARRVSFIGRR